MQHTAACSECQQKLSPFGAIGDDKRRRSKSLSLERAVLTPRFSFLLDDTVPASPSDPNLATSSLYGGGKLFTSYFLLALCTVSQSPRSRVMTRTSAKERLAACGWGKQEHQLFLVPANCDTGPAKLVSPALLGKIIVILKTGWLWVCFLSASVLCSPFLSGLLVWSTYSQINLLFLEILQQTANSALSWSLPVCKGV